MPYSRFKSGDPSPFTPPATRPDHRTIARRGIEAAIWGLPLVQVEAIRRAFFSAGAHYGDILFCSEPVSWKLQMPTPDSTFLYAYFVFNLVAGPIVLEVPETRGTGLVGSVVDAWEKLLVELGPAGARAGEADRYLLLPPNGEGSVPDDCIPLHAATVNGYGYFRMPVTHTAPSLPDIVSQFRLYRLSDAADPPAQNLIDISDMHFDGVLRFDERLYDSLARIVGEEPVQTRDFVAMGQLRSIGIVRGQPYAPDTATRNILRHAAIEAQAHLTRGVASGQAYWPHTQWIKAAAAGGPDYSFLRDDRLELDERGTALFLSHAPAPRAAKTTFSLGAFNDLKGFPLDGGKDYVLRVPACAPASDWTVTAYDLETATFFIGTDQLAVRGNDPALRRNDDGSFDVWFGPRNAVDDNSANFIPTLPDKHWFAVARFYEPTQAILDKSWVLPNIEPAA